MSEPIVFQEKTTYGDQYTLECPYCGKDICDLWDSDLNTMTTNVHCDYCRRDVDINIEFTCDITAYTKEGNEPVKEPEWPKLEGGGNDKVGETS